MNRRVALPFGGLLLVVGLGCWFAFGRSGAEPVAVDAARTAAGSRDPRGGRGGSATAQRPSRVHAALREHMRTAVNRRIEIVALGPNPVTVTREAVLEAIAADREAFDQCLSTAGGREALMAVLRGPPTEGASDEGAGAPAADPSTVPTAPAPRPRRVIVFDVAPNGTIDPNTVAIDPPVPPALAACVRGHLATSRVTGVAGPAGAAGVAPDGVRVAMPLRAFVPLRSTRDGGVP